MTDGNSESDPSKDGESPYSVEPIDKAAFTKRFDETYTRIAVFYDWFVRFCPIWRNWLNQVLSCIEGPRVLEVSFGTGYLLTKYPASFEVHGVEYNKRLLRIARRKVERMTGSPEATERLVWGNVEDLPYRENYFDSVVVTMAFTGYPDGNRAMSELKRVLKVRGRLVIVDVNFPHNRGNWLGMYMAKVWQAAGDILRDMAKLFEEFGLEFTDKEIGGFGSVHIFVARKKTHKST